MEKKSVTLFIVTNTSGETKKLVVSLLWIRMGLLLGLIIFVILLAATVDYLGLLAQTLENKRLRVENAQLNKQFQMVEEKVNSLENALERVKIFTTKLKLITHVEGDERSLKLSMGPQEEPKIEEPLEQREGFQKMAEDQEQLLQPKPVDSTKGEIAALEASGYQTLSIRVDQALKEAQLREQSQIELWESLQDRMNLLNSTPSIKPAKGWYTSRFGYRPSPFTGKSGLHTGLDIAGTPGTPIFAPADGVVTYVGYEEGYGKMLHIEHGFGISTRYGHSAQIYVRVGQKVSRWDIIATIGNTGRSTGPHLHYEVRVNGVPKDPSYYILDD